MPLRHLSVELPPAAALDFRGAVFLQASLASLSHPLRCCSFAAQEGVLGPAGRPSSSLLPSPAVVFPPPAPAPHCRRVCWHA